MASESRMSPRSSWLVLSPRTPQSAGRQGRPDEHCRQSRPARLGRHNLSPQEHCGHSSITYLNSRYRKEKATLYYFEDKFANAVLETIRCSHCQSYEVFQVQTYRLSSGWSHNTVLKYYTTFIFFCVPSVAVVLRHTLLDGRKQLLLILLYSQVKRNFNGNASFWLLLHIFNAVLYYTFHWIIVCRSGYTTDYV